MEGEERTPLIEARPITPRLGDTYKRFRLYGLSHQEAERATHLFRALRFDTRLKQSVIGLVILQAAVLASTGIAVYLKGVDIEGDAVARKATTGTLVGVSAVIQILLTACNLAGSKHGAAESVVVAVALASYLAVTASCSAFFYGTQSAQGQSATAPVFVYTFLVFTALSTVLQLAEPAALTFLLSHTRVGPIFVACGLLVVGAVGAGTLLFALSRLTKSQVLARLNTLVTTPTAPAPVPRVLPVAGIVPEAYDVRSLYRLTPVRDQGDCGCCVAFACTSALSDRLGMASGTPMLLSPQFVLQCNATNVSGRPTGCHGNNIWLVLDFLRTTGTVPEECFPFKYTLSATAPSDRRVIYGLYISAVATVLLTAVLLLISLPLRGYARGAALASALFMGVACVSALSATGVLPFALKAAARRAAERAVAAECAECCPAACTSGEALTVTRAATIYAVAASAIKHEILTTGPVVASIDMYDDFPSGLVSPTYVYRTSSRARLTGSHAVTIVGWTSQGWRIRNQWGLMWGQMTDPGYLVIGYGQASIEYSVFSCTI